MQGGEEDLEKEDKKYENVLSCSLTCSVTLIINRSVCYYKSNVLFYFI